MANSADNKKTKAVKHSWLHGLKTEFKKIVWPDKKSLVKQTIAVLFIAIFAGAAVSGLDYIIQFVIKLLVR